MRMFCVIFFYQLFTLSTALRRRVNTRFTFNKARAKKGPDLSIVRTFSTHWGEQLSNKQQGKQMGSPNRGEGLPARAQSML